MWNQVHPSSEKQSLREESLAPTCLASHLRVHTVVPREGLHAAAAPRMVAALVF